MSLRKHENYERLVSAARQSHAQGRRVADLAAADVDLARLYCYGFRGHVIGAFHATRVALETLPGGANEWCQLALDGLAALANQSLDPVPADYRALVSTFHRYDTVLHQVLTALDQCRDRSGAAGLEAIRARFQAAMERVTACGGIVTARDDEAPPQASFVVPGLGITIVPLVYGDHHSWNLAFLTGKAADVPRHLHRDGVEIHLGYGELRGQTLLGRHRAEVTGGYAMAIPPGSPHGFVNTSGHDHCLPFVFGSRRLGGWGIVLDVEPQPAELADLVLTRADGPHMKGLVFLDREIDRAAARPFAARWTLIGAATTFRPHSGGLVLSLGRATAAGLEYPRDSFRIVGIARGRGMARVGPAEAAVGPHDHFGVPAGLPASLRQMGDEPLVALDAVLALGPAGAS